MHHQAPPTTASQTSPLPDGQSRANWWQALFNQSGDAQIICNQDGTLLEINPKAGQLFGIHTLTSGSPVHLEEILTPQTTRSLLGILHSAKPQTDELTSVSLLTAGRLTLIADLQLVPLTGNFWLIIIKDASRRWRLESHAQRLMAALDSTPDVVFLTDSEFRLTFTNAAFQTTTGYTIEEALGRTAEFLRAPDEIEKVQEYAQAVRNGSDWMGELLNRRRDGELYPVETTISPIYDQKGHFLGSVAFERDITIKKRLQEDLLLERNFVRSILNSLESAVYTLDHQFHITHINEAWKKFPADHGWLHLPESPQIGCSILQYVESEKKRRELESVFHFVLTDGHPREFRSVSPKSGLHWIINISPWRHEEQIRGLIYKVTDNTQFSQLQSQLYQAQKMETVGALAAGIAHDFNNFLLAIRGNVSLLLLNTALEPSIRSRLEQIEKAATQATDITQQLSSFSRSSDEQICTLDFNEVIEEAKQLAERSLRRKISIHLIPSPVPVRVRMDSTRAQQVLLNLCINAHDAMPEGGQLKIANRLIRLTEQHAAKFQYPTGTPFLCCSIADSGVGIPEEIMTRIFDPFFTTKAKGKGTGLGLAIVHSVITKAGGGVEVSSELGKGTTFHIYLPVIDDHIEDKPARTPTNLNAGSGRILVVDDLDLVHQFTREFLEEAGYEVLVADSADAALQILETEKEPIKVLLTDYNMPEKNGWQLIQEVSKRWPAIKLILASGYLDEKERYIVEQNHAVRILCKPYTISEATRLIAEMLADSETPD